MFGILSMELHQSIIFSHFCCGKMFEKSEIDAKNISIKFQVFIDQKQE